MGRIDDVPFSRASAPSPIKFSSDKYDSKLDISNPDHSAEHSEKEDQSSKDDNKELGNINVNKEFSNDIGITSKPFFGQIEDAMVTKAKLIAAQQFLLQNFQKQREALVSAQNVSSISTLPIDSNKKLFSPFPFSPFPFSLPPTPVHFPALPNMPKNNNEMTDPNSLKQEEKEDVEETETDSDSRNERSLNKSQTENAFLLFSQIQNYRRQLLESGSQKFPHNSVDSNSIRPCEKLVTPF